MDICMCVWAADYDREREQLDHRPYYDDIAVLAAVIMNKDIMNRLPLFLIENRSDLVALHDQVKLLHASWRQQCYERRGSHNKVLDPSWEFYCSCSSGTLTRSAFST